MSYIGNTSVTQAFTPAVDYFSGTGSATAFTLSRPVASVAQVQVVVNNVAQNPSTAYTVSSSTITFTSAPSAGTNNIYVYYTSPITQVIAPGQGTVGVTQLSATGTASSSNFLRGDNTWSALSKTNLPAGSVLQVKQITSTSIVSTTNTTWTDTGISWTFDNALQTNSKVLVHFSGTLGQPYAASWAKLAYVTIYEGATNRGDTTYGIAGSAANLGGTSTLIYDVERMSGACLFTPSSTSPTIGLYFRTTDSSLGIKINSNWDNSIVEYRSMLTGFIMEVSA